VDISNYTDQLTPDALDAWRQLGIRRVIVQSLDPPPGYPTGVTRQQVEACQAAGFSVEAYVYLWTSQPHDIARQLDLLRGLSLSRVWLDCEDTMAASPAMRVTAIRIGLQAIADAGFAAGIYTGRWWWTAYAGDPQDFSHLPLWPSTYDGVADRAQGFAAFGGWTEAAMKQYAGTSSLAGIGGLDLDAY
jgi:hypothetical protein